MYRLHWSYNTPNNIALSKKDVKKNKPQHKYVNSNKFLVTKLHRVCMCVCLSDIYALDIPYIYFLLSSKFFEIFFFHVDIFL